MTPPTIIYDDACPMCRAYTKVFHTLGWSGRDSFAKLPAEVLDRLDLDRARHEIPLFDAATGYIRYGIDSHMAVLGRGLPALRPLFDHPWLRRLAMPLYWMITYNRRIIAGTKPPTSGFDCAPDYHVGWRLAYVGVALTACWLLNSLAPALLALLLVGLVGGLLIGHDRLGVLGHLATIALGAALVSTVLPAFFAAIFVAEEGFRRLSC